MLRDNLARVRQRIQQACQHSGRDPASVTVVCVTKGISVETIRDVVAMGATDLGENRVQEARHKQLVLGSRFKAQGENLQPRPITLEPVRWHLIGHLQRNKAKDAVELFDVIHSVDSATLAQALDRHATTRVPGARLRVEGEASEALDVFIQVNVSGEATKFGCQPDEALGLARIVTQLPHLHLKGLMTIAPFSEDPEASRPHFRHVRELRDALMTSLSLEPSTLSLSMGMSQDVEVAIEEGADVVRIGSAIFGDSEKP